VSYHREIRIALLILVACSSPSPTPSASPPVAPPRLAADAAIPDAARELDSVRDARIKKRFGSRCRFERACGALWGIDCNAAADGPYYYVVPADLETVSTCGGACMGGHCTNCPPREWTCPTY
jgi:hypothetical protein